MNPIANAWTEWISSPDSQSTRYTQEELSNAQLESAFRAGWIACLHYTVEAYVKADAERKKEAPINEKRED